MPDASWTAVGQVSGIASLIAFGLASLASVLRQWIKSRERLVELAPQEFRPRLIDRALGTAVPVADLAKRDRRDLYRAQLRFRERQLLYILIFLLILAVLGAALYIAARLLPSPNPAPSPPPLSTLILDQWKEDQPQFLHAYGLPAYERKVNLWFQFFQKGVMLYNVPDGKTWALEYDIGKYVTLKNPDQLISEHHLDIINWPMFQAALAAQHVDATQLAQYHRLIEDRLIIGGIGTLYVRHNLLYLLGTPQQLPNTLRGVHTEDFMDDLIYSQGPEYELLAGLPNRAADDAGNRRTRAIVALFHDGTYKKFTVNLNETRRRLAGDR